MPKTRRRQQRITTGGPCHSHWQGWGSQGELQHKVLSSNKSQNVIRLVMSPRKRLVFHPSTERQLELFKRLHCRVPASEHTYNQVFGVVRGTGRLMYAQASHSKERPHPTKANGPQKKRGRLAQLIGQWGSKKMQS